MFVIAEFATLLVDIHCPRGSSLLSIHIHFSGLAALMTADIARNLSSLVCSCLDSYCTFVIFPTFDFLKISCFLHWIPPVNPIFMLPYVIMDLPIFEIAGWATLLVDIHCPRGGSLLSIPIYFSELAALMRADIARNL